MIHRSPYRDIVVPDCTLTELVFETVERRPDHPAVIDGISGAALTYRQWAEQVRRTAAGLASRGMVKGDILAIFCPNLPEYGVALHAASLAGGAVTTANPLYTPRELRIQLEDSGAKYVLTVPAFLDKVRQAIDGLGIREVFVIGGAPGATSFADLAEADAAVPQVAVRADDVFVLPYSSGTTGLPKGVMLTHRNLVANVLQILETMDVTRDDRLVALLPYFHIYGMVVVMHGALRLGATQVTLPRFEMETFLGVLERHRITRAHLVPPLILLLANHEGLDRHDLSALKEVFTGAAPMSHETAVEACAKLGVSLSQGYGLTETSPVTHLSTAETYAACPGTIGVCVANTEAKVIDDEGQPLPPGQRGEICVRGPQVMKGYLNRPEATAEMIEPDGWLHTGDVGYADDEGRFFIVDRLKELIKYKGCQVAPAELEALLLTHPAVVDAAVIGVPDDAAGELPKGFVVLREPFDLVEIQAYVAERVAPFKKLRLIEAVDAIPKSPSGKILRRVLLEREAGAGRG